MEVVAVTFQEFLDRWVLTHGGAHPTRLIRVWLKTAFAVSTPVLFLSPNAITLLCGLCALSLAVVSYFTTVPAILCAIAILLLGLFDSIDGVVAIRTSNISLRGAFLDSVIDRITDAAIAFLLWTSGAPIGCALSALGLTFVHEYMRARAAGLGLTDIGLVTVGEKPTRIAIGFMFYVAVAVLPSRAADLVTYASYTWLLAGLISVWQLQHFYRGKLRH